MRGLPVTNKDSLVITPLIYSAEHDVFDADSVDLRLGCHFLLPKTLDQPFFSPDRSSATSLHTHVHVPLGQFLVVPAHQTILGATLEFIKLPADVSGQVLTKSSVARTFIVVKENSVALDEKERLAGIEVRAVMARTLLAAVTALRPWFQSAPSPAPRTLTEPWAFS